jgi:hypothetical protein
MTDDKRDEVADAIRARQSLQNDGDPGDGDLNATNISSGLHYADGDDIESVDEQALDDDDLELTGDDA